MSATDGARALFIRIRFKAISSHSKLISTPHLHNCPPNKK